MSKIYAPKLLIDHDGAAWRITNHSVEGGGGYYLPYEEWTKEERGLHYTCKVIEKGFHKFHREEPAVDIVRQGKYECAPAALAMLTGEKLFTVKRACAKFGWNNDSRGIKHEILLKAARFMGYDLITVPYEDITHDIGPALLGVPSLNYKGRAHGVYWDGKQILDPNHGFSGRYTYGTEYSPETIQATDAEILSPVTLTDSERAEYDKAQIEKDEHYISGLKQAIADQLNGRIK
jgi:hypothetical protein